MDTSRVQIRAATAVAATLAACMGGPSRAAVVSIDVGTGGLNITGVNAGIPAGGSAGIHIPGLNQTLWIYNAATHYFSSSSTTVWGFKGDYPLSISWHPIGGADVPCSPTRYLTGDVISGHPVYVFTSELARTAFRIDSAGPFSHYGAAPGGGYNWASSDFGPGSYVGFISNGCYGYLEVTWSSVTNEFRVLSGAYESVAGVPIVAGATPIPAPAPLISLVGAAWGRRRNRTP